jgi:hypothetical protein
MSEVEGWLIRAGQDLAGCSRPYGQRQLAGPLPGLRPACVRADDDTLVRARGTPAEPGRSGRPYPETRPPAILCTPVTTRSPHATPTDATCGSVNTAAGVTP